MNAPAKLLILLGLALLTPWASFAASADVVIVLNGNTEVNREGYNYVRKTFSFNKVPYTVTYALDPSTVKPGQYKTVVVFNTGTTSGLDPVLAKFISGYPDKKSLFLVNLHKNRRDLTVTTFTAASSPEGVDGITAASAWKGSFGGEDPQKMHLEWIKVLVKFLGRA